jgi:acetate kinase
MRARIAEKLAWLGVSLAPDANTTRGVNLISHPQSPVALYVIPTNEELMIAHHTLALLAARRDQIRHLHTADS